MDVAVDAGVGIGGEVGGFGIADLEGAAEGGGLLEDAVFLVVVDGVLDAFLDDGETVRLWQRYLKMTVTRGGNPYAVWTFTNFNGRNGFC